MDQLELVSTVLNVVLSILTAMLGYKLFSMWISAPTEKEREALKSIVAGFCYLLAFKILLDSAPLQDYWQQAGISVVKASVIVNAIFVMGLGFLLVASANALDIALPLIRKKKK